MQRIAFQHGHDDGIVGVSRENCEVYLHPKPDREPDLKTELRANTKEQAEKWEKLLVANPDLTIRLAWNGTTECVDCKTPTKISLLSDVLRCPPCVDKWIRN